mgnify:CR=1 FL=1
MKALSDPSRVKILKLIQKKELCVCEIHVALGIAQSTASKHLKVLEEAGLVIFRKEGLWVNYTLSDGSDSPYAATILGNLKHWLENDADVIRLTKSINEVHREKICRKQPGKSRRSHLQAEEARKG